MEYEALRSFPWFDKNYEKGDRVDLSGAEERKVSQLLNHRYVRPVVEVPEPTVKPKSAPK